MSIRLIKLPLPSSSSEFPIFLWADGNDCPVQDFLLSLQDRDLRKVTALLVMIEEHGPPRNREKFKLLEGQKPLFEIKSYQVRILGVRSNNRFILLEGCLKKKAKLDKEIIERAMRRWVLFGADKEEKL